jgi:hypothetical protein
VYNPGLSIVGLQKHNTHSFTIVVTNTFLLGKCHPCKYNIIPKCPSTKEAEASEITCISLKEGIQGLLKWWSKLSCKQNSSLANPG